MNVSSLSQRYLKSNDTTNIDGQNQFVFNDDRITKVHASFSLRCLRMIAFDTTNTALLLDQSSRSTNLAQEKKSIDDLVSIRDPRPPINLHTKKVRRFIHRSIDARETAWPSILARQ